MRDRGRPREHLRIGRIRRRAPGEIRGKRIGTAFRRSKGGYAGFGKQAQRAFGVRREERDRKSTV